MSDIAIRVENLGKMYRIGAKQERYGRFTETAMDALTAPFRRLSSIVRNPSSIVHRPPSADDTIWALRDVSFEVQRGEVVGIIGRNGAGKSTLLKILSRITEPATGRVELHGRVSSLLEVGTGFHPELTGRENVYLNGAILGMRRQEIENKFDEIIAFSGVEKFIDTPVKRYSSGMHVRLAFAVAAHLEPEILLVDEVLAVGDAEFQKKCLGKIGEVAGAGRTVLFVSHNMAAVQSLCRQAFLLDAGRVVFAGPPDEAIDCYLGSSATASAASLQDRVDRRGDGSAMLTSIVIEGTMNPVVRCGDKLRIRMGYSSGKKLVRPRFLIRICDHLNRPVFVCDSAMTGWLPDELPASGDVTCTTAPVKLVPDVYTANVTIFLAGILADSVKRACSLEVQASDMFGTGRLPTSQEALWLLEHEWAIGTHANEPEVAL